MVEGCERLEGDLGSTALESCLKEVVPACLSCSFGYQRLDVIRHGADSVPFSGSDRVEAGGSESLPVQRC